jgi:NADPH-dependent curcumin reductase CurA
LDACTNYKTADLDQALAEACPGGIDVYFDNVAGPVLESMLRRISLGARIPLVGLISQSNAAKPPQPLGTSTKWPSGTDPPSRGEQVSQPASR